MGFEKMVTPFLDFIFLELGVERGREICPSANWCKGPTAVMLLRDQPTILVHSSSSHGDSGTSCPIPERSQCTLTRFPVAFALRKGALVKGPATCWLVRLGSHPGVLGRGQAPCCLETTHHQGT